MKNGKFWDKFCWHGNWRRESHWLGGQDGCINARRFPNFRRSTIQRIPIPTGNRIEMIKPRECKSIWRLLCVNEQITRKKKKETKTTQTLSLEPHKFNAHTHQSQTISRSASHRRTEFFFFRQPQLVISYTSKERKMLPPIMVHVPRVSILESFAYRLFFNHPRCIVHYSSRCLRLCRFVLLYYDYHHHRRILCWKVVRMNVILLSACLHAVRLARNFI